MRALVLSAIISVGCTKSDEDSGQSNHDHSHHHGDSDLPDDFDAASEVQTHNETVTISYVTDPTPIPESALFTVTFTVSDGSTVTSADATMPTHGGHGMTVEPEVTDNGDGTFTAAPFEFHMPGYWVIHAVVADSEGTEERADFDVDCCD